MLEDCWMTGRYVVVEKKRTWQYNILSVMVGRGLLDDWEAVDRTNRKKYIY